MGVSKNNGIPKSSILIGFSIINHPFWGTPYFRKHPYNGYLSGISPFKGPVPQLGALDPKGTTNFRMKEERNWGTNHVECECVLHWKRWRDENPKVNIRAFGYKHQLNVGRSTGKYTSPMDPMGKDAADFLALSKGVLSTKQTNFPLWQWHMKITKITISCGGNICFKILYCLQVVYGFVCSTIEQAIRRLPWRWINKQLPSQKWRCIYLDLPKGAEWMIKGAHTPSLRVQTAPFGRCW